MRSDFPIFSLNFGSSSYEDFAIVKVTLSVRVKARVRVRVIVVPNDYSALGIQPNFAYRNLKKTHCIIIPCKNNWGNWCDKLRLLGWNYCSNCCIFLISRGALIKRLLILTPYLAKYHTLD